MADLPDLRTVEVPVRFLFTVPEGVDDADVVRMAENTLEHSTARESFIDACDQQPWGAIHDDRWDDLGSPDDGPGYAGFAMGGPTTDAQGLGDEQGCRPAVIPSLSDAQEAWRLAERTVAWAAINQVVEAIGTDPALWGGTLPAFVQVGESDQNTNGELTFEAVLNAAGDTVADDEGVVILDGDDEPPLVETDDIVDALAWIDDRNRPTVTAMGVCEFDGPTPWRLDLVAARKALATDTDAQEG